MTLSKLMKHGAIVILLGMALLQLSFTTYRSSAAEYSGQDLYKKHCARCHGADGTKGMFGAKNLRASILSDSDILNQVLQGKGFMPGFRKKLSDADLQALVPYIKSLRRN